MQTGRAPEGWRPARSREGKDARIVRLGKRGSAIRAGVSLVNARIELNDGAVGVFDVPDGIIEAEHRLGENFAGTLGSLGGRVSCGVVRQVGGLSDTKLFDVFSNNSRLVGLKRTFAFGRRFSGNGRASSSASSSWAARAAR